MTARRATPASTAAHRGWVLRPTTAMRAGTACAVPGVPHPPTSPTTPTQAASALSTAQGDSVRRDSTVRGGLTSRSTACQVWRAKVFRWGSGGQGAKGRVEIIGWVEFWCRKSEQPLNCLPDLIVTEMNYCYYCNYCHFNWYLVLLYALSYMHMSKLNDILSE